MSADPAELLEELREIEDRLAALEGELPDLSEDLRDLDDGAAATRIQEEEEALIETVRARRDALLAELGDETETDTGRERREAEP